MTKGAAIEAWLLEAQGWVFERVRKRLGSSFAGSAATHADTAFRNPDSPTDGGGCRAGALAAKRFLMVERLLPLICDAQTLRLVPFEGAGCIRRASW